MDRFFHNFPATPFSLFSHHPATHGSSSGAIISVFFRLDEVLHNITKGKRLKARDGTFVGDSDMMGINELFTWLDAVSSRTSAGPVLLVAAFADRVQDRQAVSMVSSYLLERLQQQEHPVLARIEQPPASDLIFFVVDNTRGLQDPGVCTYREALLKLAEAALSATQLVPFNFLQLQDLIVNLTREPAPSRPDSPVMESLRKAHRQAVLHRLTLTDFARLYEEVFNTSIKSFDDGNFRLYLDFLHQLGVITHSSAAAIDNLIVINPMWLLSQITAVIRRPDLHPLPGDNRLATEPKRSLYELGILESVILESLWKEHDSQLQSQLLAFCLQVRQEQCWEDCVFLVSLITLFSGADSYPDDLSLSIKCRLVCLYPLAGWRAKQSTWCRPYCHCKLKPSKPTRKFP